MQTVTLPIPELTDARYFDVAHVLEQLEAKEAVQFPPFEVVHLSRHGLSFCLNMLRDPIQNALRKGDFYERRDLDALQDHVKTGAHIIDIGANIGNHALYFAQVLQAQRVVVIEPNPLALAPLVANVVINNLQETIDLSALGVGLGAAAAGGYGMKRHDRNLGATKMKTGQGTLMVMAGDDLFGDETPDLIKIDVEGMELEVLAGLGQTIARTAPLIFIEVNSANEAGFAAWKTTAGYNDVFVRRLDDNCCNYLISPETT